MTSSSGTSTPLGTAATALIVLGPFALGYFLSYLFRSVNAVVAPNLVSDIGLTAGELGGTLTWMRYLYKEAGKYELVLATFDAEPAKSRVDEFYDDRIRVGFLIRMGKAREALQWAEALPETLRVHAEEINDPKYLQYMGIARLTGKELRAMALARLDSLDLAEVAVEELLESSKEIGPYSIGQALLLKLRIAIKRNNSGEAMALVDELEAMGPSLGMWYDYLSELKADALRLQERYDEAEQVLKAHVRIYGGHALGYYKLGQLYEEMRRPDDAVKNYERFLEMWSEADEGLPELVGARTRLAALSGQE